MFKDARNDMSVYLLIVVYNNEKIIIITQNLDQEYLV